MIILSALLITAVLAELDYTGPTLIVIGDSEIAPHSGYGDCLQQYLPPGTEVFNFAIAGYNTDHWLQNTTQRNLTVQSAKSAVARGKYVVCSQAFGANDESMQWPGKYIPPDRFLANMITIHDELKEVCHEAIVTTPYSRRYYNNKTGKFKENGMEYAELGRVAARQTGSVLIDLHNISASHYRMWTAEMAFKMNKTPDDYTHLNGFGCNLTARWWLTEFDKVDV